MNNKKIAKYLRGCADLAPVAKSTADATFLVQGTSLRITCKYDRDSIRNVADKFEKGLPRAGRTENSIKKAPHNLKLRPFSIKTFRDFIEDLEPENALEYFRLFNPADLPAGVRNTVRRLTQ